MQEHAKIGKTLVFPSINIPHLQVPHERESTFSSSPQTEFLRKRCLELSEEKIQAISQIERLKADNARLHASTKSWFNKYQEMMRSREESLQVTPVKNRNSSSKEDLLFFD